MYAKILVPLDGSKLAEASLDYASELAARSGADLILLSVCGPDDCHCGPEGCYIQPMHRLYVEHTAEELGRRMQDSGAGETKVESVTLAGDVPEEILRYAEENEVSLIVMSTHGHSGVKRWVMGGVADKIVRNSDIPVRLFRSYAPEEIVKGEMPEKKILVPLDGSETAEQILPYVMDHARICNSEVVLVRVCESPFITADYPGASMQLSWKEHVVRVTTYWQQQCSRYLEDVEGRFVDQGINIKSEALMGDVPHELSTYIESNHFNLVAMTTHGRSGVKRWVLGSVAEKILDGTSVPILLVRAR